MSDPVRPFTAHTWIRALFPGHESKTVTLLPSEALVEAAREDGT